jgi:hypothetical protein
VTVFDPVGAPCARWIGLARLDIILPVAGLEGGGGYCGAIGERSGFCGSASKDGADGWGIHNRRG